MTHATGTTAAEAWTVFWSEQGQGSRCLARAPEILQALDAHWRAFAFRLWPTARIIDLGCGAGAVGQLLRAAQPRLHVTGIDIARTPSSGDPKLELLPNIAMESLPFADRAFGAAVSQFAYEYGRSDAAAAELARVLIPGAPFSFLIHHSESPVIAGMRGHKRAIEGICDRQTRTAFVSGNIGALDDRMTQLKRQCPKDPIIDQVELGLRVNLNAGRSRRMQVWEAVDEALAPELVMLKALDVGRVGHDEVEYWVRSLEESFQLGPPAVVRALTGEPIAWALEGIRRLETTG